MWRAVLTGLLLAAVCAGPPVRSAFAQDATPVAPATDQTAPLEPGTEQVTITATRIETPVAQVASSVTVITRQQIEERKADAVADVLRDVPGLDVVQTAGPGSTTSVFIRGANSEHTLVLIDGVEANDPFTPARTFDFGALTTDNIERIEIIRGPQSTLYGSDAIGGVINIITRKGKGAPTGYASFETGSFGTFREAAGISGSSGLIDYSIGLSHLDDTGISQADSHMPGNHEKDGYHNTTLSGRVGWAPSDVFRLDLTTRVVDAHGDLDNFGGPFGDDPNYTFSAQELFTRLQGTFSLLDGKWESKLGVSFTDFSRDYDNPTDHAHPLDSLFAKYRGELVKFDWQNDFYLADWNTLTFGLETQEEIGKDHSVSTSSFGPFVEAIPEKTARTNSAYIQDQINIGNRFITTLGVRDDDHEQFGSKVTYHVASSYLFPSTGTRLKATYGTGFKAPTLYQLFSPYGNPALLPEQSTGWDAGVEQSLLKDKVLLGVTYFKNEFKNLIDFGPMFSFINVGQAEAKGIEASATWRPCADVTVRASYTRQRTEDKATGLELLRRPCNKAGLDVNWRVRKDTNLNLAVAQVGPRADTNFNAFPSSRVKLGSYTLVNLAATHDLSKRVQLFGRVENLLDQRYEDVFGFGTPGIGVFGGVKVTF